MRLGYGRVKLIGAGEGEGLVSSGTGGNSPPIKRLSGKSAMEKRDVCVSVCVGWSGAKLIHG